MKVLVRADVSAPLGTGHLRRMCNLVAALPQATAIYAVRTDDRTAPLLASLPVHFLGPEDELSAMVRLCRREKAELILSDLLSYPAGYLASLKAATGCKLVSFHEFDDWRGDSDLGVNYNTTARFEDGGPTNFLRGPRYCILNSGLLRTKRKGATSGVLATFGGSDPSGFAVAFLDRVAKPLARIPFHLHVGPLVRQAGVLDQARQLSNVTVHQGEGLLFELMASCRLAVSAAGNSMYELMYLGLFPLVVAHNAHQEEFARNAAGAGACAFFGRGHSVDWDGVARAAAAHYERPPLVTRRLVDGHGVERLVHCIVNLRA
jgi:spore coat polysaccharide biosynthesis predicted glycosyltransferase SpsG